MPAVKRQHPAAKRVGAVPLLPLGPRLRLLSRASLVHLLNRRPGQCNRRKDRGGSSLLTVDKTKEWQ